MPLPATHTVPLARRILPHSAGNAGCFLSPPRSLSPSRGCCVYPRSRRRRGAPPGKGLVSSSLGAGQPTEAATLPGTLLTGQLRRGPWPGHASPPQQQPTRHGQGRPSSRRRPRQPLDPQARGPASEEARRLQRRPARRGPRPEQQASGVARPLTLGDSVSNNPLGPQFPLVPNKADNTSSREKKREDRTHRLRTVPGTRPRQKAALPPPRLLSILGSPQPPAPGLTHLTAPPTTAGRPVSIALTSAGPPPRKRSFAAAHRAAPLLAVGKLPLSGRGERGWAGGRPHVRTPREGHAHPRPRSVLSESWGRTEAVWRFRRSYWSHFPADLRFLVALSPNPTFGSRGLTISCAEPKLCAVCCPHPYCKLENPHPGVPGPPVAEFALHRALVLFTVHTYQPRSSTRSVSNLWPCPWATCSPVWL